MLLILVFMCGVFFFSCLLEDTWSEYTSVIVSRLSAILALALLIILLLLRVIHGTSSILRVKLLHSNPSTTRGRQSALPLNAKKCKAAMAKIPESFLIKYLAAWMGICAVLCVCEYVFMGRRIYHCDEQVEDTNQKRDGQD